MTDNFICTGGREPFRDHIACTGKFLILYQILYSNTVTVVQMSDSDFVFCFFCISVCFYSLVQVTLEVLCIKTFNNAQYR